MIESKTPAFNAYGPIQVSVRISDEPYKEGKYAPYLHIKAYHTNCKKIKIHPCNNELIEMDVPKKFKRTELETFISVCGRDILKKLQEFLDAERESLPEPLTYNSEIPFLGRYVPIRIPSDDNPTWSRSAPNR